MAGTGQMTATGARATQLRQASQGLLDEGIMEIVASDVGRIGKSIAEASTAVTGLQDRTAGPDTAVQGVTAEIRRMTETIDLNDRGLEAQLETTLKDLSDKLSTLEAKVEQTRAATGQEVTRLT